MIMGMKKLLSLPPNLVDCFHAVEHVSTEEWFCTSDPVGARLGSGGGTTWLCAIRENIDSDPCVSLGKRAEVIPELIVFAITSL